MDKTLESKNEFQRLYTKYFDCVYRICFLYMKSESDALDVTQEVFLKMLENMKPKDDEKSKAWLIVTASNCCKTHLKKWWRAKRSDQNNATNERTSETNEVLKLVLELEEKYRIPTYLYYYEGYTTGEISKILKTNQSTIQTRLAKARELLKIELGG